VAQEGDDTHAMRVSVAQASVYFNSNEISYLSEDLI
jgi:hypothetical protein